MRRVQVDHCFNAKMIRKPFLRLVGSECDVLIGLQAIECGSLTNKNVIDGLAGSWLLRKAVPGNKGLATTNLQQARADPVYQFAAQRTIGRTVEITSHQIRYLSIISGLNTGYQFTDLGAANPCSATILHVHIPNIE